MENSVTANKLCKSFGEKKVLDEISFQIEKGEIFGLLGPSGAGKTTLIKILTGQLAADSGESVINGKSSSELKGQDCRGFGIMMDNFGVYERLSCFDNLKVFARIYGISNAEIHDALKKVGLSSAEKAAAGRLSKGMKSRLRLARVFMTDPRHSFP